MLTDQIELLKKYLGQFTAIPPLEWLHFIPMLRLKKIEKDEFFYRQGEPVSTMGFIVKGLLYNFYTDNSGEKNVKYFIKEGSVAACYSSLIKGEVARFSSQAIESTTMITIEYADLLKLYKRHACWERIGRVSAEKLYIEKEDREYHFLALDAEARYRQFVEEKSDLVNRVPQYIIASYLGISPVSLSRIRGKKT